MRGAGRTERGSVNSERRQTGGRLRGRRNGTKRVGKGCQRQRRGWAGLAGCRDSKMKFLTQSDAGGLRAGSDRRS